MTRTVTPRQFIAALGLILLLAGLTGAALPITAVQGDSGGTVECGSTFTARSPAEITDDIFDGDQANDLLFGMTGGVMGYDAMYSNWCASHLAARKAWSWPFLAVGLVAVVGALVVRCRDEQGRLRAT